MDGPYGSRTIPELKAELRRRKARTSGRKMELVERLEAYDRNANFGAVDDCQCPAEFQMMLPDPTTYKDLHSDMVIPALFVKDVDLYLANMEKQLDKKAINLYVNSYVNFVRVSVVDRGAFFKAEVRAEMKATVTYKVDIQLSSESVVKECQCECAAGMGPHAHCKHINCVLYGITEYTRTKTFKTIATCTQQLQTFHQAKRHLGSPVKVQNLKLHIKDTVDFDPRPAHMQKRVGYVDFVRNTLVNEQLFSSSPIMHVFPPANPYGLFCDHDYCALRPDEDYLEKLGVVSISPIQRQCIEIDTRDSRKRWKEERQKRICSSAFGTVCKSTEKADKAKLAKRLVQGREFRCAATTYGITYEHIAVQRYEETTGVSTQKCGLFVSETLPFLASTPDRIVSDTALLEVKCPYTSRHMTVSPKTVPYLYRSQDGSLQLKRNNSYFFQVQGQMYCLGPEVKRVDFCVFTQKDFQIIKVLRDEEFIKTMVDNLQGFHDNFHKDALLEKFCFKNYGEHFCPQP